VDLIRRQADCATVDQYYIAAFGTPSQPFDTNCHKLYPVVDPTYVQPARGLWSGDDVYRLVRMLVGVEIQALAGEWLDQWYGVNNGQRPFALAGYPYRVDANARLNSGLTVESALLFHLPTYQPDGFYAREVRANQTECVRPVSSTGNNLDYLNDFPVQMGKYIQGGIEALITPNNGVRDSNRGYNDAISILVRRGREMGAPSFTDLREQISLTPSGCKWDSWTGVGACDPALLFKASALAGLKTLYTTPGDVELVVGAALSTDTVPASVNQLLHDSGIDQTQAWLLFGEVDRILSLDAFGRSKLSTADSFYTRFRNDDPARNQGWADSFITSASHQTATVLNQRHTNLQCLATYSFAHGGFSTFSSTGNVFFLPFPGFISINAADSMDVATHSNCDAS